MVRGGYLMNKTVKMITAVLLPCLLFAGCAQNQPEETAPTPPADSVLIRINTDGLGEVASAEGDEQPVFDEQYQFSSSAMNVEKGTVINIACRPTNDWRFYKWTKDGEYYSNEQNITVTADAPAEYIAHFTTPAAYEGEPVSDIRDASVMGDVLALPSPQSGYDEKNYVFVFELNNTIYRAVAEMPADVSKSLWDLEFDDPDHDRKEAELIAPLPITQIDNLSEHMPADDKLTKYIGMTGDQLLAEGWTISGFNTEEMLFDMHYGAYAYDVTFEGTIKDPYNFDEEKDMKDLTVKAITCSGIGSATDLNVPLE